MKIWRLRDGWRMYAWVGSGPSGGILTVCETLNRTRPIMLPSGVVVDRCESIAYGDTRCAIASQFQTQDDAGSIWWHGRQYGDTLLYVDDPDSSGVLWVKSPLVVGDMYESSAELMDGRMCSHEVYVRGCEDREVLGRIYSNCFCLERLVSIGGEREKFTTWLHPRFGVVYESCDFPALGASSTCALVSSKCGRVVEYEPAGQTDEVSAANSVGA